MYKYYYVLQMYLKPDELDLKRIGFNFIDFYEEQ